MAFYQALSWHPGEEHIHALTRVPPIHNPTQPMFSQTYARRVAASPTIALGTVDSNDRVWCTVWGGDLPIAQQVAPGGVLGIRAQVDCEYDPVVEALYERQTSGEVIKYNVESGKMVSGLSIRLEDRDRVKLFGRMVAGSLSADTSSEVSMTTNAAGDGSKEDSITILGGRNEANDNKTRTGTAQLVLKITQSLGNCPKYLNKKIIKSHPAFRPRLLSDSPHLPPEAISHIHAADIFFIASRGPDDMDCNHRGGMPGFVRVQQPSPPLSTSDSGSVETATGSVLVWPEYSGNNLYQTLGNIAHNPHIGMCIPSFTTGAVLYISGRAEILIDKDAASVISKTKLAVRFTVSAARFVSDGLAFRGTPCEDNSDRSSSYPRVEGRVVAGGMSPYNPRVRYLTSELTSSSSTSASASDVKAATNPLHGAVPVDEYRSRTTTTSQDHDLIATLTKKLKLTPTITSYIFTLSSCSPTANPIQLPTWQPGQYIALDFSNELYMGYSHMRDDDPSSINDDFIRTFTVSSPPTQRAPGDGGEPTFEIIVRNVGAVTRWLSWQNERSGMTTIGVRGFGGDFSFKPFNIEADVDANINNAKGAIRGGEGEDTGRTGENLARRKMNVFIAAGIGITPFLGHLPSPASAQADASLQIAGSQQQQKQQQQQEPALIVLWTLHVKDINLAVEVLRRYGPATRKSVQLRIFVTGTTGTDTSPLSENLAMLENLEAEHHQGESGVEFHRRRTTKDDLTRIEQGNDEDDVDVEVENWYLCVNPTMRGIVQDWLDGRSIVYENFDY